MSLCVHFSQDGCLNKQRVETEGQRVRLQAQQAEMSGTAAQTQHGCANSGSAESRLCLGSADAGLLPRPPPPPPPLIPALKYAPLG